MKKTIYKLKMMICCLGILGFFLPCHLAEGANDEAMTFCKRSAKYMLKSNQKSALSDYWLALAKSKHLSEISERKDAKKNAQEELDESLESCKKQYDARIKLCENLNEEFYQPIIDPANFVTVIDNPYLPLIPGTTFFYQKINANSTETIEFQVTHATKNILGVQCTEIRDIVRINGVITEDTLDWFAQDNDGNVWYFGELSQEFENGELASLSGSWKAGVDDAQPGIVMKAHPLVGDFYRQEFFLGDAEDAAEIISIADSQTVPYGNFNNLLTIKEFTPIEPDALEHKFYAPGIGLILELDPENGDRTELISIQTVS